MRSDDLVADGGVSAPRERPIIFSAPMVRSILNGSKTQTRRIVKTQSGELPLRHLGREYDDLRDRFTTPSSGELCYRVRCPYGEPGDRLYVKESWWASQDALADKDRARGTVAYRADVFGVFDVRPPGCVDPWRSSLYMPRWASRLTLRVTGVRVERLQAITEEDARAEGAPICTAPVFDGRNFVEPPEPSYRHGFLALWQAINADRAPWASDPWCWIVSFERMTT